MLAAHSRYLSKLYPAVGATCRAGETIATVTQVDASVRGADFWWPKLRTFGGHQCGPLMAISADFLVAMDTWMESLAQICPHV